mgnify:CR=1 FL=1|jgi:uncharacterized membrane protein
MFYLGYLLNDVFWIFFVVAFIIIIYLIFRRIKIKKQETFEKRDN